MAGRQIISTENAPAAIGPYSQGVAAAGLLFCSGQIPLDPETGELVEGDIAVQAERCLRNLQAVCAEAETDLKNAARITVYLTDLSQFGAVNQVFEGFFERQPPARVTVGVSELPKAAQIEIDAIVPLVTQSIGV